MHNAIYSEDSTKIHAFGVLEGMAKQYVSNGQRYRTNVTLDLVLQRDRRDFYLRFFTAARRELNVTAKVQSHAIRMPTTAYTYIKENKFLQHRCARMYVCITMPLSIGDAFDEGKHRQTKVQEGWLDHTCRHSRVRQVHLFGQHEPFPEKI